MNEPNRSKPPIPSAIKALGGLILAVLTLVALSTSPPQRTEFDRNLGAHDIIAERSLIFIDRSNGWVDVTDAMDGQVIGQLEPGTENFVRGVVRGLVRERKSHEITGRDAFELQVMRDGTVTLYDPTIERRVVLNAFGRTNVGSFLKFIQDPVEHG